ncbi:fused response regulator/phosphatase [Hydrogenovibrio kuenenii]|uniref:fused response regulator/phosphatase n=1 Tax=Hydrogenovibrio kuenenii TaxID=63658 RepID=UPI00046578D3|nr:fused response regulator/phosphatase [Hydrogenovibrio kuenenii]
MRILVVDPSETNRFYLKQILEKNGYQVLFASNGLDAYQIFETESFDLVISEITLPFMSAYDLVKKIKSHSLQQMIPVFIVTDEVSSEVIQNVLEVGADDFLQKPYSEQLFLAKIRSLIRMKRLTSELYESHQTISLLHKNLELEHRSAERIFEKFVHGPGKLVPGLETHVTPASIFNGDVFLSTVMPSGSVLVLLGDFTGHGLPAAIGAIPVAEVFYSMVKRGRTPGEVLNVINSKLKDILPIHIFFGCIMMKIQPNRRTVSVFNAGMQPIIQLTSDTRETRQFKSTSPPLGILDNKDMTFDFTSVNVSSNDSFFLYTDGIIEVLDNQREMFGVERLVEVMTSYENPGIPDLVDAAKEFSKDSLFEDDVSIIKLSMKAILKETQQQLLQASNTDIKPASQWRLTFEFCHRNIKINGNPTEGIVDAIMAMQPLISFKEDLYLVISELYINAVEHGLLNLDSSLKDEEDGFQKFNQQKRDRLSLLEEGKVTICINQTPTSNYAGNIKIKVFHEGQQFTSKMGKIPEPIDESDHAFSGRGLFLVQSLCQSLELDVVQACATAVYTWQQPEVMNEI